MCLFLASFLSGNSTYNWYNPHEALFFRAFLMYFIIMFNGSSLQIGKVCHSSTISTCCSSVQMNLDLVLLQTSYRHFPFKCYFPIKWHTFFFKVELDSKIENRKTKLESEKELKFSHHKKNYRLLQRF